MAAGAVSPVAAQNYLDEIVNTIVANNGELQGRRQEINAQALDAADENVPADPTVTFGRVWGSHGVGNKLQLDVNQELEWPGVYSSRRKAAELGTSAALQEVVSAELDMAMELRMLLNELVYVRQQIKAMQAILDNFNQLKVTVEKEIEGGELTVIDQKKITIEGYKISNDLTELQVREQQIEETIRGYCTVAPDLKGVTYYPLQEVLSIDNYIANVQSDPGVETLELAAKQEEKNAETARLKRIPNLTVGYEHQTELGDRFDGFTLGVNLPVFQGRHARQAAMERKVAVELSREALVAKKTAEVKALYKELMSAKKQMEQFNDVFGDNRYMELLNKAYKGGQMTMREFILEMNYYSEATMAYLATEYNYQQALTAINRYKWNH